MSGALSSTMPTGSASFAIVEVVHRIDRYPYRSPMKFGGRVVTDVEHLTAAVTIEAADGRRATGVAAMPLGNVWAWPSRTLDGGATLAAMRTLADRIPAAMVASRSSRPLMAQARYLHDVATELAQTVSDESGVAESMPELAALVTASPFDAALFDAFGRLHGVGTFDAIGRLGAAVDPEDGDPNWSLGAAAASVVSARPQSTMPLYHLVGALDPLTSADVATAVKDGLPETLGDWIVRDGLTHLKIKLDGADSAWDLARIVAVDEVASSTRSQSVDGAEVQYSLDFNERCVSGESVVELLRKLERDHHRAFGRIQYIEQPTSRNLDHGPDLHAVAAIKPVVLDEGLLGPASWEQAAARGYTGMALKACKGIGGSLVMAKIAVERGLFLCVQDLTCLGLSFAVSASLSAHVRGVRAVEGNGRQYCPTGFGAWAERLPDLMTVVEGQIATGELSGPGLGYPLPRDADSAEAVLNAAVL